MASPLGDKPTKQPPASAPLRPPPLQPKRRPTFALSGFPHARPPPPQTPVAFDTPDPFSLLAPTPAAVSQPTNPWQHLFASSGAPTPSIHPSGSPFSAPNAIGAGSVPPISGSLGVPSGHNLGSFGGSPRGSPLESPAVSSRFSRLSIDGGSSARSGVANEAASKDSSTTGMFSPPSSKVAALPAFPISLPSGKPVGGALGGAGRKPAIPAESSRIKSVLPSQVAVPIPSTHLVLDLRTHHLFSLSRMPSAVPVTIPSTLLRRPNFTLAKLLPMLGSDAERARVESFRQGLAKIDTIIVYDQDGTGASGAGSITGLLAKFEREGFEGELQWVKGGFNALLKSGIMSLVEETAPAEENIRSASTSSSSRAVNGRELPIQAFQQGSVVSGGQGFSFDSQEDVQSSGFKGFGGDLRLPRSAGGGGVGFRATSTPATQTQAANPFFDNIRQNAELAQGITERIPLDVPPSTVERADDLPKWLRGLVLASPNESADALAMQFYKVELGEQRRLQGIMDHHTRHPGEAVESSGSDSDSTRKAEGEMQVELAKSGSAQKSPKTSTTGSLVGFSAGGNEMAASNYFPYSITAGLEKGGKNRFKNIWPFDHARVRLGEPSHDDGSDYINASFILPRATNKRYIATQGPLPSTFQDFWTLCWEQNVRVIVMLTKQHEGGQIKCSDYWSDGIFGPMRLHHVATEGGEDQPPSLSDGGGFFFPNPPPSSCSSTSSTSAPGSSSSGGSNSSPPTPRSTIKRTFELSHVDYPHETPRLITQIQYVSWPDFDIPETPEDLLHLIQEVNSIDEAACDQARATGEREPGPIVVHCSAGVGRTGSYLIVDAVLDAMRREMRTKRDKTQSKRGLERRARLDGSVGPWSPPKRSQSSLSSSLSEGGSGSAAAAESLSASDSSLFEPLASSTIAPFLFRPSAVPLAPQPQRLMTMANRQLTQEELNAYRPSSFGSGTGSTTDSDNSLDHSMEIDRVPPRQIRSGLPLRSSSPSLDGGVLSSHSTSSASASNFLNTPFDFNAINLGGSASSAAGGSSRSNSFASGPRPTLMALRPPFSTESSPSLSTDVDLPDVDVPSISPTLLKVGGAPAYQAPRIHLRGGACSAAARARPPTPISEIQEPVQAILEDIRQQRMSLCQTLRQYVFAYRVVIQGILDMVDEERGRESGHDDHKKRQASPTELHGGLSKRPSVKQSSRSSRQRAGRPAPPSPATPSSVSGSIASPEAGGGGSRTRSRRSSRASSTLHMLNPAGNASSVSLGASISGSSGSSSVGGYERSSSDPPTKFAQGHSSGDQSGARD